MMATTLLKPPHTFSAPAAYLSSTTAGGTSLKSNAFRRVCSASHKLPAARCYIYYSSRNRSSSIKLPRRSLEKFLSFAANGEAVEAQTEIREKEPALDSEPEPEIEGNTDGAVDVESSSESDDTASEEPNSVIISSLNLYKEALSNGDASKIVELESFFKSIEDEKIDLEKKVATSSEELSYERDRILRISADFDNFRKRTERERLSVVTNARGEVLESLLPVLDNFERAKAQIKVETEGEEKVNNSYQSIYKQFVEILGSLGVVPVETVGKPFDPMLHEAIMREDSTEYEDGIILEEYRKGFQLGERLLRPSMVKVSAGPGPTKHENEGASSEDNEEEASETNEEDSTEAVPTHQE